MKKAYGYMRVSSTGQVDGDGFDRQEKAIREYATLHGYEIAGIYKEEGVSGTLVDRPALAEMLVDLGEDKEADTVIIEKMDRLARDLIVQETICSDLTKSGFELVSTLEGADLLADDPSRTLIRQVFGAVSQYEKRMLVLKLKAARDRIKKKTGKCEGRKGYSEIAPDTVQKIKSLNRKPRGGKKRTARQIASELNKSGFKTADGKSFTGNNVGQILFRMKK